MEGDFGDDQKSSVFNAKSGVDEALIGTKDPSLNDFFYM